MTLEEIKKTGDKKAILKYRTQCAKDSVKEYREQMRDATPEEQEAIDKYIKSISKPTGVNVFDFYEDEKQEQIDFVQPKKKIPCTIKVQADGEYISKNTAIDDITTGLCEEIACSECPFDKPDIICKVQKWLRQLPSVAIPNKVGHWEYNQYDGNPNIGNWHCSECRNIVSDMPTCMGKPLYEFCPNCGCPMEIER